LRWRSSLTTITTSAVAASGHGVGNFALFNDKYGSCLFGLADAAKKSAPCF
jgi:hypothetical protein